MVDRPTAKHPKKAPKTPEFAVAGSDELDDKQDRQPKKASKTPGYSDNEQGAAVKCIVMYSTEDEQEPAAKQPKKASGSD